MQEIEQSLIQNGWAAVETGLDNALSLEKTVLAIAGSLGTPQKGRSRHLVERLRPTERTSAWSSSLSAKFGLDAFPFHADTSHWSIPARYLILACLHPGAQLCPTLLVDRLQVDFSADEKRLLRTAVFWIKNGRRSFYSTIQGLDRNFLRFDPGCMEPQTIEAVEALGLFSMPRIAHLSNEISWKPGKVVVINNWRMLHARAALDIRGGNRILLRCLSK